MVRVEEQRDFEAARTVQALCLAAHDGDLDALTQLWSIERQPEEWRAIAEQAVCALVGAMRSQARGTGESPAIFHKSSIQALIFLEARGAPPAKLDPL